MALCIDEKHFPVGTPKYEKDLVNSDLQRISRWSFLLYAGTQKVHLTTDVKIKYVKQYVFLYPNCCITYYKQHYRQ